MKPTHQLKNRVLIVKLPKTYEFQYAWKYFMEELPNSSEFNRAKYCVVDGSIFKNLGSLGISGEILEMGNKFLSSGGEEFALCGFQEDSLFALKQMASEKQKFPKNYKSLNQALKHFQ